MFPACACRGLAILHQFKLELEKKEGTGEGERETGTFPLLTRAKFSPILSVYRIHQMSLILTSTLTFTLTTTPTPIPTPTLSLLYPYLLRINAAASFLFAVRHAISLLILRP